VAIFFSPTNRKAAEFEVNRNSKSRTTFVLFQQLKVLAQETSTEEVVTVGASNNAGI